MRIESSRFLARFHAGGYYHIYNRTNNKEQLFGRHPSDEVRFINYIRKYCLDYFDILAYCLLPNHFHLVVRIKSKESINRAIHCVAVGSRNQSQKVFISSHLESQDIHRLVSKALSCCFSSYTKSSNYLWERKGNLFNQQFNRKVLSDQPYILETLEYVNTNAVKHGLVTSPQYYPWSSYTSVLLGDQTWVAVEDVLRLYRGRKQFINRHAIRAKSYENVKPTLGVDFGKNVTSPTLNTLVNSR